MIEFQILMSGTMALKQEKSIIWDWNGTLLNDLDLCIESINVLLGKRNLPLLDRQSYKEVFSFPVKNYYRAIGFDFEKEDFSVPAHEFIDLYNRRVQRCALQPSTGEVLTFFRENGFRQFVLSAMKQDMLEKTLRDKNIFHFFEAVAGLSDHYANSKIERGKQMLLQFNIEKHGAFMIGDTIHDAEVASELGIKCLLIPDGHQSAGRLEKTGAIIVPTLRDLIFFNFDRFFETST